MVGLALEELELSIKLFWLSRAGSASLALMLFFLES
jgi:hypothetical protein